GSTVGGGGGSGCAVGELFAGLRYAGIKQSHGGDRRSEPARQAGFAKLKTAEALAEIMCVRAATIRRDGELVAAVHQIVENCGEKAKARLLAAESRLSREAVCALAKLPPERQRHVVGELLCWGKLPRSWRNGGRPASVSLPREPQPMAETLVRRFGTEWAVEFCRVLSAVLNDGKV